MFTFLEMSSSSNRMVSMIISGAGTTTVELVKRLERSHDGRVVALEASPALLDRARERVTDLPKRGRIFFRQHLIDAPLPFEFH